MKSKAMWFLAGFVLSSLAWSVVYYTRSRPEFGGRHT